MSTWWSAPFLLPGGALFARRTVIEDPMLHDELPGYREYATRVHSRVVPRVF